MRDFQEFRRRQHGEATDTPASATTVELSIDEIEQEVATARVANFVTSEVQEYLGPELASTYATLC